MKPKIYVETSIVSYLAARPSKNIIVAAYQQITHSWWKKHSRNFDLYISEFVVQESEKGDPKAAQKRIGIIDSISLLEFNQESLDLAQRLMRKGLFPEKAAGDASHIAISTVHGMDYLLTWNCKHIANAFIRQALTKILEAEGYEIPVICTPQELMGE